ncbi:hypothetical protein [Hyphomicrobium sp. MC1]|uniref:hypothetical protein n=1 Tax=Hyphomicrobium sp. (strain MC1) TaxID=717785 RepID=UPI000213E49C|nr:hypothetical protein [Hyphomicrobium sp. MC1]CCB67715.1 protein of unknown function [Hyphomicrobium sp. MC1]
MSDDHFTKNSKLISIESGSLPNSRDPAWIVKMGYFSNGHDPEPMLAVTWHLPKKQYDEAGLVTVARHYLHRLCSDLGQGTAAWKLDDEQFEAVTKAKPPSGDKTKAA